MSAPGQWIGRWTAPLVFGIWTYGLIFLLATKRYLVFLRPEFGLLLPLAVAVDSQAAGDFANDQWGRVQGTFNLSHTDGKPVPFIENAVLTPTEAPKMPYLF